MRRWISETFGFAASTTHLRRAATPSVIGAPLAKEPRKHTLPRGVVLIRRRPKKRSNAAAAAAKSTPVPLTSGEEEDGLFPEWYTDEAGVKASCGMLFSRCNQPTSDALRFMGQFQQHWTDFRVTELTRKDSPVSREADDSLPSVTSFAGGTSVEEERVSATKPQSLIPSATHLFAPPTEGDARIGLQSGGEFYLECTMHKQNVAHQTAVEVLCRVLRIRPRDISWSGTKDRRGDTVQRIRLRGVPPGAALEVNDESARLLRERQRKGRGRRGEDGSGAAGVDLPRDYNETGESYAPRVGTAQLAATASREDDGCEENDDCGFLRLSSFRYEREPLVPGQHFGNHFDILLRDVTFDDLADAGGDAREQEALQQAVDAWQRDGFPNFFGAQRFSWFAGHADASFSALRGDWILFARQLLNFTSGSFTLEELLQRERGYPLPLQDRYRCGLVDMLRINNVHPQALSKLIRRHGDGDMNAMCEFSITEHHRLRGLARDESEPENGSGHRGGRQADRSSSPFEYLVRACCHRTLLKLEGPGRMHLMQRAATYMWNQALSIRIARYGPSRVLLGDFVIPPAFRQQCIEQPKLRADMWKHVDLVTQRNASEYSIFDVVHPPFSFDATPLPLNAMEGIYHTVCARYGLDWNLSPPRELQLRDFRGNPRFIRMRPQDPAFEWDTEARTLQLSFALERGSFATVALTELMQATTCVGQEHTRICPLPLSAWRMGHHDPSIVESRDSVYSNYYGDDTIGAFEDEADISWGGGAEPSVIEIGEGGHGREPQSLFRPDHLDPAVKAEAWSTRHLVRNSRIQERTLKHERDTLFEPGLSEHITDAEIQDFVGGHVVPLRPNTNRSHIGSQLRQRERRLARGVQRKIPHVSRQQRSRPAANVPFAAIDPRSWRRVRLS